MATYKDSGVDIEMGDKASLAAYTAAINTFSSRKGMIGGAIEDEGGFAGLLDFGPFYLVMNCDGVGTKIDLAVETGILDGLGYDLLAMTVDDAICMGAEVTAITNTIDTPKVNPNQIALMMKSLEKACIEQKVVIPGGEIAELGKSLNSPTWNSTAIGIVQKEKMITGENVQEGDIVIALQETGLRSNGFSLVRHIIKESNIDLSEEFENGKTWAQVLLTPSKIYHRAILALHGRYQQSAQVNIKAIAHITGGGIASNFARVLKKSGMGASLDSLFPMPEIMKNLQKQGEVSDLEAYKTWNGGNGMLLVVSLDEVEKTLEILGKEGINAKKAGVITLGRKISYVSQGYFESGEIFEYEY